MQSMCVYEVIVFMRLYLPGIYILPETFFTTLTPKNKKLLVFNFDFLYHYGSTMTLNPKEVQNFLVLDVI